jgi:TolB-like protein
MPKRGFRFVADVLQDKASEPVDTGKPQLFVDRFEGRRDTFGQELAYGITEGLSAALSRQTGLEIVTQESAAGYLLRGGVRVAGQRCRVSAQLQDVAKNLQIWAENFDVDPSDSFELQDACVYRIAMAVRTQFWLYEGEKISDRDVDELSTGQLLKRAAFNYVKPDIALWRAIPGLMRRVLEKDPDNFMALAMSAGSIIGEYNLGYRSPDPGVIDTAFQQIEKAQRLNQRSDMVRMTKALLLLIYRKAYGEARASVQRALELNPNYNLGYSTLAHVNVWSGDYVTGIENAEHAIEGDPFHPYCYLFSRTIGYGHFGLGNFEDAATSFVRADQFVPDLPYTILGLAASYWEAGDREAARQQVQQLRRLVPEIRVGIINLLEFRDPTVQTRLIGALRAAGMPDRARPAND